MWLSGDVDTVADEAAAEEKTSVLTAVCAKSSPVLVGTVFSLRHCMLSATENGKADEASTSASASASVRSCSCPRDVDDDQELVDDSRPSRLFLEALRRVSGSRETSRAGTPVLQPASPRDLSPAPAPLPSVSTLPAAVAGPQIVRMPHAPTLPKGPPPSQRPRSAMAALGGAGLKRPVPRATKTTPDAPAAASAADSCDDLLLERAHFLRAVQFVKQQVASNVAGEVDNVESVPRFGLPPRPRSAVARLGGSRGPRSEESKPSLSIPPQISEDEEEDGEGTANLLGPGRT